MKTKDQPLEIKVRNGRLVISVGISALAYGVQESYEWTGEKISDELQFAKDVARELSREDEQGNTEFYFLLDKLSQRAIDNGTTAIVEN